MNISKKTLILFIQTLCIHYTCMSQVGIGILNPDPHAELDITSDNKGILIPNVTLLSQTNPQPIAPTGSELPISLLIYNPVNTNGLPIGYYYWSGTIWDHLITTNHLGELQPGTWNKVGTK